MRFSPGGRGNPRPERWQRRKGKHTFYVFQKCSSDIGKDWLCRQPQITSKGKHFFGRAPTTHLNKGKVCRIDCLNGFGHLVCLRRSNASTKIYCAVTYSTALPRNTSTLRFIVKIFVFLNYISGKFLETFHRKEMILNWRFFMTLHRKLLEIDGMANYFIK